MPGKPFTILVDIPLKPGAAAEFLSLASDLFTAMRDEPTLVQATALQSSEDPDTIVLYEVWKDREDFVHVQMARAYRSEYETKLPGLLRSPRKVTFFDAVVSVP